MRRNLDLAARRGLARAAGCLRRAERERDLAPQLCDLTPRQREGIELRLDALVEKWATELLRPAAQRFSSIPLRRPSRAAPRRDYRHHLPSLRVGRTSARARQSFDPHHSLGSSCASRAAADSPMTG